MHSIVFPGQGAQESGMGRDLAAGSGVGFHYEDFRAGWSEGVAKSREWGIYRQRYCGCLYSETERYASGLREPAPGTA